VKYNGVIQRKLAAWMIFAASVKIWMTPKH
jgi:cytidylate kinase